MTTRSIRLSFALSAAVSMLLAPVSQAEEIGRLFSSPGHAAAALVQAANVGDMQAVSEILGPSSKDLIEYGDQVDLKNRMEEFSRKYFARHKLAENEGSYVLIVGENSWPFPIPITKKDQSWYFDTAAGREEIINRRVGENELNAIAVCRGYVKAQKEYAERAPNGTGLKEFAQKFNSSPERKDGLFWPVKDGERPSPIGPFVARAVAAGYGDKTDQPDPYHGYLFRILTAQGEAAPGGKKSYIKDGKMTGGFALIAYPSQWGSSGIMTFVVNQEGKVYEKNLGQDTAKTAGEAAEYNPDSSWNLVTEKGEAL